MARSLRKVKSKIRSFNWYWYVISGRGICHSIYGYTKANNKYMKNYDKNKESSYLQYWDVDHLFGKAMLQKCPASNFERIKDNSQLNEDFIKNYNGESNEGYFLVVGVQYLEKNYMNSIMIFSFYVKEWKLKKYKRL